MPFVSLGIDAGHRALPMSHGNYRSSHQFAVRNVGTELGPGACIWGQRSLLHDVTNSDVIDMDQHEHSESLCISCMRTIGRQIDPLRMRAG